MKHPDMGWRAMTGLDLGAVEAIATIAHPDFYERPDVLAERRQLYPSGAHLLEVGERAVGYVLSHPWRATSVPALNTLVGALPEAPDTYYLHDLAVLPVARRMGAASYMLAALEKHAAARGFASMMLIAVNNSGPFWTRHGFDAMPAPALDDRRFGYGADAKMMGKRLD